MAATAANQTRLVSSEAGSRLTEVMAAMMRPGFYPNHPQTVELRQTHLSCVFLAGDRVYKIKKPVRFPFVDAATLALRQRLCNDEVRLNRRLAEDVYLGVVGIVRRAQGLALEEGGAETRGAIAHLGRPDVVEYAVMMRHMPESATLESMVREGRADEDTVDRVVQRIARFHEQATAGCSWRYGAAAAVWRLVTGNLDEMENLAGATLNAAELVTLREFSAQFVEKHWNLLNERAKAGRTREGHGDLRAEHVYVMPDGVRVLDCVEFSERLRYGDVASEVAFLAMDLERLNAPALATHLVRTYAELSGDAALPALLPLYKCYRAAVRGKVDTFKSLQPGIGASERSGAARSARRYFALALGYARRLPTGLIVVYGLPGSGKSTVARLLSDHLGLEVLSSDAIRKRLAGIVETASARAPWGEGIYTLAHTRRTYEALAAEAQNRLAAGSGAILDATFADPDERRRVADLAHGAGAPLVFVECRAPEGEIIRRLCSREGTADASDADVEIYLRMRADFDAVSGVEPQAHLIADTAGSLEELGVRVERILEGCRMDPLSGNGAGDGSQS